ncbi:MAG: radical SAM protein [Bacteroidales bacterium]|nr:radical SAM protein [Bacteroidales bacterium]
MKIYLILAASENDPLKTKKPFMQPLALPILASCAPEHDYTFTDLLWEDFSSIDFQGDYDLIGISFRAPATETAFKIADKFRTLGKIVIMGGPQASVIPQRTKEHANAVVVGEGEKLWPVLLNDFQNNELKDFYITSPNENLDLSNFKNYYLSVLPDITSFPVPLRQLYKGKYAFDMVFTSRGCPINCNFCAVSTLFGTRMRFKKTEDVVAEINTLGKMYYLLDDTVFGRHGSYDYYLELYPKIAKLPEKRFWSGQANLDAAAHDKGKEVIKHASEGGLTHAFIGFETLNPDDMKNMATAPKMGIKDKSNFMADISENVKFITNNGILISAWFTIGLQHDSHKSIIETIEFCRKHHILPVLSPIQALEGTSFFDLMKSQGNLIDQKTNISNVNLSVLTNEDYIKIFKYNITAYRFLDIFRNTLFYFKKIKKLKRGTYELIYRTIFIVMTQLKLRKLIKKETIRFGSRMK